MPMWWGGLWEKGGFGPPFFLPPGVGPTGRSEKIERLFIGGVGEATPPVSGISRNRKQINLSENPIVNKWIHYQNDYTKSSRKRTS